MNKRKLNIFFITFFLLSCGGKKTYIYVSKSDSPTIIDISINDLDRKIQNKDTFVSYFTFSNLVDCGCSNSESVILNYIENHYFDFYRLTFDAESETFIEDYNRVVEITGKDDESMAIPSLIEDENNKVTIPLYPRMLFISEGYIALNTDENFVKYLDKYIRVLE